MSTLYPPMGKRIAQLRHEHHLTQQQLAEKLDISVKHMSEIERGLIGLSLDKLVLLCDILSTSLDFLVRGKDSDGQPKEQLPAYFSEVYDQSSPQQQEFLNSIILAYRDLLSSDE